MLPSELTTTMSQTFFQYSPTAVVKNRLQKVIPRKVVYHAPGQGMGKNLLLLAQVPK
jgi:hypothetical protein